MALKPEFEAKLRKAKVLTKWKKNFNSDANLNGRGILKNQSDFCQCIISSFSWADTEEGYLFWKKISEADEIFNMINDPQFEVSDIETMLENYEDENYDNPNA
jgi:hypothetical protein